MVGREEYLRKKPAAVVKLMQALKQAADFIKQRPAEARKIIAQRTKFPIAEWENYPLRSELSLDQGLLLFMEDQAAWMIQNRLTDQTKTPNFIAYFDPGPLLKADPEAMRLAIPGQKSPK